MSPGTVRIPFSSRNLRIASSALSDFLISSSRFAATFNSGKPWFRTFSYSSKETARAHS